MAVTKVSLVFGRGKTRPTPHVGDRRVIAGLEHIRVFRRSQGCLVVSSGRYLYDWVPLELAVVRGAGHHLTPVERSHFAALESGKKRARDNSARDMRGRHNRAGRSRRRISRFLFGIRPAQTVQK